MKCKKLILQVPCQLHVTHDYVEAAAFENNYAHCKIWGLDLFRKCAVLYMEEL